MLGLTKAKETKLLAASRVHTTNSLNDYAKAIYAVNWQQPSLYQSRCSNAFLSLSEPLQKSLLEVYFLLFPAYINVNMRQYMNPD
jgi:hypothetical protein